MEEIAEYAKLEDSAINEAKKKLAWEVTAIVHGRETADSVKKQAEDLFERGGRSDDMPSTSISTDDLNKGPLLLDIMLETKLIPSKGEGRRLIQQGGVYLNDTQINDFTRVLTESDFADNEAIIRKGKKVYHRLTLD